EAEAAIFGSWVAEAGLEDYEEAIKIAKAGLDVHPGDAILLNNLSFALARGGDIETAQEGFDGIRIDEQPLERQSGYRATEGRIHYRSGDIESGRDRYLTAIRLATGVHANRIRATASLLMAEEELRLGTEEAQAYLRSAFDIARKSDHPEVAAISTRL